MADSDTDLPTLDADSEALKRHRRLFRAVNRRRNPPLRRTDITVTDESAVRRAVKAASLGNAMEWFDFGIYSYLAVTIGQVFFPSGNDTVQLLSSFATFAVSFLVRPLGGMVFGPMGDKIGRKKVLALTMILMAIGTFAIGLIPSYAAIGFWSPALLILFRLVQGFSTGGEYGGASTFIAEYAPDRRRGFFGSFLELGTLAGYVGASGLVTVLTALLGSDGMHSWGWRVPFLVAGPIGLIGLYLRLKLDETPAFQKLEDSSSHRASEAASTVESTAKGDIAKIFREYWPTLILCISLVGAYNICDYMLLSYMPTYLSDEMGYSETHGLLILIITMVVLMLVINQVGKLSDRVGRKPVLMAGMLGFLVLSIPSFLLVEQGSLVAVSGGMLMLGLSLVCLLGTMSAALPALFPTQVRYGSLSIGYNLSASLFGGTTPLVITALISLTGSDLMPAFYAVAAALVGVVSVACMKETARRPLAGSPPSVATAEEAAEMVESQAQVPRF
ncbi:MULTISPECIES: glycine betaine/L-proline transporter ProP [Streptomyces]|jgi:MHS family proline/betaine transporter-like MFS transporter|uniref:Putative proline/betaine transporter n=3 Tax=Streptomyces griseoaurantiacus TaxID=68213 RepID=F3NGL1_9ACTN|nr:MULTISPECIES: glycine betaine/L-proline transporter ProP [Streptomyces]EGG47351.1 putative osmoprotectant transporter [Streptomyces griseoaurantiacus M045]MBA5223866.1 glycine betaine/L-proline transporter ProP [Streptomyces griseoaurantiacus]MDX3088737.1 glycine betaine/L-proline transporter ProP [Streptomyces sp. ME12-02E]MDX3332087.1 glycine betaine/L-proline transporter ProP [Streptomyces sp. ME02-6978a]MDX3361402.1 glycine betaine/L-proline transporter ProP [Streptomyces sp. ME02-6978.